MKCNGACYYSSELDYVFAVRGEHFTAEDGDQNDAVRQTIKKGAQSESEEEDFLSEQRSFSALSDRCDVSLKSDGTCSMQLTSSVGAWITNTTCVQLKSVIIRENAYVTKEDHCSESDVILIVMFLKLAQTCMTQRHERSFQAPTTRWSESEATTVVDDTSRNLPMESETDLPCCHSHYSDRSLSFLLQLRSSLLTVVGIIILMMHSVHQQSWDNMHLVLYRSTINAVILSLLHRFSVWYFVSGRWKSCS